MNFFNFLGNKRDSKIVLYNYLQLRKTFETAFKNCTLFTTSRDDVSMGQLNAFVIDGSISNSWLPADDRLLYLEAAQGSRDDQIAPSIGRSNYSYELPLLLNWWYNKIQYNKIIQMYILSPYVAIVLTSWSLHYLLALLGIFQFLGGRVIHFPRTSVQKITTQV